MTESGGTGGAAGPGDQPTDHAGTPAGAGSPGDPSTALPRWQPLADAPVPPPSWSATSEVPAESALPPALEHDEGSLIPDQLHDAPAYIPPPIGSSPGGIMPPPNPADVPSSAWITTAPQTAPRQGGLASRFVTIIGAIVGVVVLAVVIGGVLGVLLNDKGKILFGTAAGSDLCSVGNQTTTVKTTDPVFFAAVLKHHMDGQQAITFHITKDGAEFLSHPEPADGSAFDCYGNQNSIGALEPGNYVFEVIHGADIEATGKLTVQ